MKILRASAYVMVMILVLVDRVPADDLQKLVKPLLSVGPGGLGSESAAEAWRKLIQVDASRLADVIMSLDDSSPLASNWIRTAVDAIAERELRSGGHLHLAELEALVLDRTHSPRARRLAYELIARGDTTAKARLIPGMLDDPSLELRYDAVAQLIDRGMRLTDDKRDVKRTVFGQAFRAARDIDQIKLLVAELKQLGVEVDLPRHFGFIISWKLIGPFDNVDGKGYGIAYPPEHNVDFKEECQGKHKILRWIDYTTDDDYGLVDLNKVFEKEKNVVAYAAAEFFVETGQKVQFRTTSLNAVKLWLNGELIDQHEIYHCGSHLDQYVCGGQLRLGQNVLLLKICQNDQPQSWANSWGWQLRVCDENGTGKLSTDRK